MRGPTGVAKTPCRAPITAVVVPFGEGCPRASRRRGLAQDSTGLPAVARHSGHTPGEYPRMARIGAARLAREPHGLEPTTRPRKPRTPRDHAPDSAPDKPAPGLTPFSGRPYHPARRTTCRRALERPARLRALRDRNDRSRGRMERITDSPDGQAHVPAQEAASRQGARVSSSHEELGRPARRRRSAGQGSEAPDGLTRASGPNSPRLMMLSRPADFARLQEGGVLGRIHSSSGGSSGPTSRPPGSGSRSDAASAAPSSGTGSGDGSVRRSG